MKTRVKRLFHVQNLLFIAIFAAATGLLLFRLGTLVPHSNLHEVNLPSGQEIVHQLRINPIGLPIQLSRLVVAAPAQHGSIGLTRLASAVLGVVTALLIYWLLRKWYGYRLALFGSLLMLTAPWFLHVARLGNGLILYPFSMTILLCLVAAWHQSQRSIWLLYVSSIAVTLSLYTPGFIWLALGVAWFERRNIVSSIKQSVKHTLGAGFIGLVILIPLIYSVAHQWQRIVNYTGVPTNVVHDSSPYIHNLLNVWRYLFIGGFNDPLYNLAGLPVADVLTTIAFIVGVYLYSKHPKATRTKQLVYLWVVATVLVAFAGVQALVLLLPIVVVLSTGGIGYLLHLWLRVFPRNPIARTFGIGIIGIVILFAVAYNLRNYFVAWPNNPTTVTAFQRRP